MPIPEMLRTPFEGEDLPHRLMWTIVEEQAALANEREGEGWSRPALVAMVFAFHTFEAYLNFVGERLLPAIWKDERNFFREEPYRGWDGKLRKVMELVGLPSLPNDRPLKTILELKKLRDVIAHGKPEKLTGEPLNPVEIEPRIRLSLCGRCLLPKIKWPGPYTMWSSSPVKYISLLLLTSPTRSLAGKHYGER